MSNISHTDIQSTAWVYRLSPRAWHPYLSLMRLDRPVGIYLLYLPCVWGLLLGQIITPAPLSLSILVTWLILFFIGAVVMRGAGCVINDLWDRDFDRAVERTKLRPLASGAITPRKAFYFLGFLCLIGFIILIQLPMPTIVLGCISLIPVILYPLAKRVTWYPQAVLGLTFNFGVLMGGAAILNDHLTGAMFLPLILIYVAALFWTIGYDTVYAHQDIEDDQKIGVKSTAQKFGAHSYAITLGCYIIMAILMAGGFMMIPHLPVLFWAGWVIVCLGTIYRHYQWNETDPASSLQTFKSHVASGAGFAIMFAIALMI